jgi:hypothetical protein
LYHALTRPQVNSSFPTTRSNLGLDETSEPDEHNVRGFRISKDNTPKDQMGNFLKEETQAQAADTPAVKIAGSVGRYSNVEYWQQKSEAFKQQVRQSMPPLPPRVLTQPPQHNNVVLPGDRPTRRALMPASRNPITWE